MTWGSHICEFSINNWRKLTLQPWSGEVLGCAIFVLVWLFNFVVFIQFIYIYCIAWYREHEYVSACIYMCVCCFVAFLLFIEWHLPSKKWLKYLKLLCVFSCKTVGFGVQHLILHIYLEPPKQKIAMVVSRMAKRIPTTLGIMLGIRGKQQLFLVLWENTEPYRCIYVVLSSTRLDK